MKITVFTSNQPRHLALIESLASIADTVYAVQECNTVFPGQVQDFFRKSDTMQNYFSHVVAAEQSVFGRPRFTPTNVRHLLIKMGDLNLLELGALGPALEADTFVVFGSSYIKGPLIDKLVERKALNIHMGTSPYYRGSSCNFWALYDNHPEYVGATIHRLSKGLDSGPMLFHALPKATLVDGFKLGMLAVRAAHAGLIDAIANKRFENMPTVFQNKEMLIRYTRNSDFTDDCAQEYLFRSQSPEAIMAALEKRDLTAFLNPFLL